MANRYYNPVTKSSESGATGNFQESSAPVKPTRFTSGGHMPPSHNPPQPHCDLPMGSYTHSDAVKTVNKQTAPARKPGTQATLETPAPSPTPKSMANASDQKANVNKAWEGVVVVNVPKGR